MKQYRITTANILPQSDDDCYLAPDDPIHELKKVSLLGGELGADSAMARYLQTQRPEIVGSDKGIIARELNIKPGTPAWFVHWFGRT